MQENIRKIKLNNNANLIFIRDERFKTNTASAFITVNLDRENVTKNALIPSILSYATKDYPTNLRLNKRLEELYGAYIGANALKTGEKNSILFNTTFLKSKFIDENIEKEVIKLLLDMISSPYLEDGYFSEKYISLKKNVLKEEIKAIKNNKMEYARNRAIEEMFAGENYAINSKGYIEDIEKIDNKNLKKHYDDLIKSARYDFILAGEYDEDMIEKIIREYLDKIDMRKIDLITEQKHKTEDFREIKEEMDIAQANIILGYNSNISIFDENYYDYLLAVAILGVGAFSKLFRNVREKHSLCYSIGASIQREKGTFLIQAGIDPEKKSDTIKYINKEVEDMKKGNITDEEFENAKKFLTNNYKETKDSMSSLINFSYSQEILENPKTIDEIIEIISNVKKEDVVKAFQNVEKDLVYFLTRKEVI